MRVLLNLIKALAVAAIALGVIFIFVFPLLAGEAHRNYARLLKAWNSPAITLPDFQKVSSGVAQQTADEDVRFVAQQLALLASAAADLGYKRLDEVKHAGGLDAFGRGMLRGLAAGVELGTSLYELDPTGFSGAMATAAKMFKGRPLLWNANKLQKTADILDARFNRIEALRWVASGCFAIVSFWWIRRVRPSALRVPATKPEIAHT